MAKEKDILSIEYDDDNSDYNSFNDFLMEDTRRQMNVAFKEIDVMGEDYLKELEEKKARQKIEKAKYIKYIMKHSRGIYTAERLMSYELSDVLYMYNEIKDNKESKIKTFFKFLFGL
jgi:hypothetical protein